MRILCDRHHADLLYSLQRLFEDRLGIEVYVPIGHEWWDEGYWQFGHCFGDDRLAQQYLVAHEGIYEPGPDFYSTYDVAHPERLIRCVTREQFLALDGWAFVMPSVQENQDGYARLAREVGARYLYQIGNTGQQVNMILDPLLINTSEYPVPEGRGVTIHQEIDSDPGGAFAFRPLTEPRVVRNFVNAFNRLPGYAAFLEVEQALISEQWFFTVHGHEGRDGNINPVSPMGEAMASAGFGWHDKPVGDGFGHVIHSWAAVGRPLIGRSAYYRNKLAAPFWTPETSIDIGDKGLGDVIAEMTAIAADADRHGAMCQALRETFDRHVNYEAEADAVRALLGL
jgi:hypothetical protein